jgi:predicted amidohydrolase
MAALRIAVASTPLTATLDEAVPAAVAAVREAARQGAAIVCLPETGLPGHRSQPRDVPDVPVGAIDDALADVAAAAGASRIAVIVGLERPTRSGRLIASSVVDAAGTVVGEQVKTQIDPSEEPSYEPGSGRRMFEFGGLRFGVAICHEAFRYPEISRALALAGAQVVFVPHYVTTGDGSLPTIWCDAGNPYNEKALLCRALENTIYVAASNVASADQGSITGIIAPDGTLVAHLPYGQMGVVSADINLAAADALIARRWAPGRNIIG